ncbi:MAG: hypothetical protein IH611_10730 [Deltaproteobacteria bacterium]|nr:hypothetical protein [Deltaproteobacteria bacterium]
MTRKIFMVLFVGLFIGAVSGAVYADGPEYTADWGMSSSGMSGDSMHAGNSDDYAVSGPVETGAVPGDPADDRYSPNDTHFNPFYPERRLIDEGGGGE